MAYTRLQKETRCEQIVQNYLDGKPGANVIRGENNDGYVNVLNKFGTAQDNSEAYEWVSDARIDPLSLELNYEANGLFAKIIDTPAREAVKHGFSLKDTDGDMEKRVIKSLDGIGFFEEVETAIKWARLFGGGLLVMIIDDGGKLTDPVNYKKVLGIDEVRVFEAPLVNWDSTAMYNADKALFGTPEVFTVSSQCGTFRVHHSRCLLFKNGRLPEHATDAHARFWGTSEYLRIKTFLRESVTSSSFAVKMMERSVQPVYGVKDLGSLLQTSDGEDAVVRRLQVIDVCRSMLNTIAIDSDGETYDFRTAPFTGVKEIIEASSGMLSAVTHIPQTILFGRSPAGMDATGESDLENYYNFIGQIQQTMLRRNYKKTVDLVLLAMLHRGKIDEIPDYEIEFNPLWSLSESEQATVDQARAQTAFIKAQTAQAYVDMGALDPSEVRAGLAASDEYDVENLLDSVPADKLFENTEQTNEEPANNSDADDAPSAAAVIVIDDDGRVLCGVRGDNGQICGPGGHIERGEAPIQTAIREAQEEFAITPTALSPLSVIGENKNNHHKTEVFLCNAFEGSPECDNDEMCGAVFMPIETLLGDKFEGKLFAPFKESLSQYCWINNLPERLENPAQTGQDLGVEKSDALGYNNDKGKPGAPYGNDNAKGPHNMSDGPTVMGLHGKKITLQHNPSDYSNVTLGKGDGTGERVVGGFEDKGKKDKHIGKHAKEMGLTEKEYLKRSHEFLTKPLSESMEEMTVVGANGYEKIYRYDYSTNEFGVINSRGNCSSYYSLEGGIPVWEAKIVKEATQYESE